MRTAAVAQASSHAILPTPAKLLTDLLGAPPTGR
jgi:hypothetical protein